MEQHELTWTCNTQNLYMVRFVFWEPRVTHKISCHENSHAGCNTLVLLHRTLKFVHIWKLLFWTQRQNTWTAGRTVKLLPMRSCFLGLNLDYSCVKTEVHEFIARFLDFLTSNNWPNVNWQLSNISMCESCHHINYILKIHIICSFVHSL